jgi:ribulose-5-phosphate 4-epimerase/fuculose-1-phosphate aldolase
LVRDLGQESQVMMLKNHGCLTTGCTVPEAFLLLYFLILSCKQQIKAGDASQLGELPPLRVRVFLGFV